MSEEPRYVPLLRAFAVVWFAVSFGAWMSSIALSIIMNQQPVINGQFPNYWIADASGYDGVLQAAFNLSAMVTIGGWLVMVGIVVAGALGFVLVLAALLAALPFAYATKQIDEFFGGDSA